VLRLLQWRPFSRRRDSGGYFCIVRFPDSTEDRWFRRLPERGARVYSHQGTPWAKAWVVEEVLQSGRFTHTVFCVGRDEYLDQLRGGPRREPDLVAELVELARHTTEEVSERRRRWKRRT
jgi:hypothetical protein